MFGKRKIEELEKKLKEANRTVRTYKLCFYCAGSTCVTCDTFGPEGSWLVFQLNNESVSWFRTEDVRSIVMVEK